VVPSPSWPWSFSPQHETVPAVVRAHWWCKPTDTSDALVRPATVVVGPVSFDWQVTLPVVSTMQRVSLVGPFWSMKPPSAMALAFVATVELVIESASTMVWVSQFRKNQQPTVPFVVRAQLRRWLLTTSRAELMPATVTGAR